MRTLSLGSKRSSSLSAVVVLAFSVAGCDQHAVDPTRMDSGMEEQSHAEPLPKQAVKRRFSIDVKAAGALRPGASITITAAAVGHRATTNVRFEILSLDLPHEIERQGWRRIGDWEGGLSESEFKQIAAKVTFEEPGYYRIIGRITSNDPPSDQAHEIVIDAETVPLWLYIDEMGGRVTDGFDKTVLDRSVVLSLVHTVPSGVI